MIFLLLAATATASVFTFLGGMLAMILGLILGHLATRFLKFVSWIRGLDARAMQAEDKAREAERKIKHAEDGVALVLDGMRTERDEALQKAKEADFVKRAAEDAACFMQQKLDSRGRVNCDTCSATLLNHVVPTEAGATLRAFCSDDCMERAQRRVTITPEMLKPKIVPGLDSGFLASRREEPPHFGYRDTF